MEPIASLAAAQQSLKTARGAVTAAVDHQVKDRLIEVQRAILDMQAQPGDAQEERCNF